MITREQRRELSSWDFPENTLGCDCDGKPLMPGDEFEVIKEESPREGDPTYLYCSVGKRGRIVRKIGFQRFDFINWTVIGEFPTDNGPKTVGCTDIHLRKV